MYNPQHTAWGISGRDWSNYASHFEGTTLNLSRIIKVDSTCPQRILRKVTMKSQLVCTLQSRPQTEHTTLQRRYLLDHHRKLKLGLLVQKPAEGKNTISRCCSRSFLQPFNEECFKFWFRQDLLGLLLLGSTVRTIRRGSRDIVSLALAIPHRITIRRRSVCKRARRATGRRAICTTPCRRIASAPARRARYLRLGHIWTCRALGDERMTSKAR